MKCNLKIKPLCGVICANFGRRRFGDWTCQGAWHGACYKEKSGIEIVPINPAAYDPKGNGVAEAAVDDGDETTVAAPYSI